MHMLSMLLALSLQAAEPQTPAAEDAEPAVCERPTCRLLQSFKLRLKDGEMTVKVDRKLNFVAGAPDHPALTLIPGEYVVVRLGRAGEPAFVVIDSGAAADLPPDRTRLAAPANVLRQVAVEARNNGKPGESTKVLAPEVFSSKDVKGAADLPETPALAPQAVRIVFTQIPGTAVMLLELDNGFEGKLQYRAYRLLPDGQRRYTDVCQVAAGKLSFENWPNPMGAIELSDFTVIDSDLENISCQ
jgi:hypothetical protein